MSFTTMTVTPISGDLGVKITGIDLEKLAYDEDFIWEMKRILAKHLVALFPGQKLTGPTAQHFHGQFGSLIDIKRKGNNAKHVPGEDTDFIKVISNGIDKDGRPFGDGNNSAQIWHSDTTPWEVPCGFIAFYCRETPSTPPKTSFLNMIKVYDSLSEELKDRIANLRVIHHQYPNQIEVKIAREGASLPLEERKIGKAHPLVRRHLPTGKAVLYLPTRRDSIVVGWDETQSRALLEELWAIVDNASFKFAHPLVPDDFIIWDNSATVHSREGWPAEKTRIMWHISAGNEVPTPYFPVVSVNVAGMNEAERQKHLGMLEKVA